MSWPTEVFSQLETEDNFLLFSIVACSESPPDLNSEQDLHSNESTYLSEFITKFKHQQEVFLIRKQRPGTRAFPYKFSV